jgi:hypothetical protein
MRGPAQPRAIPNHHRWRGTQGGPAGVGSPCCSIWALEVPAAKTRRQAAGGGGVRWAGEVEGAGEVERAGPGRQTASRPSASAGRALPAVVRWRPAGWGLFDPPARRPLLRARRRAGVGEVERAGPGR